MAPQPLAVKGRFTNSIRRLHGISIRRLVLRPRTTGLLAPRLENKMVPSRVIICRIASRAHCAFDTTERVNWQPTVSTIDRLTSIPCQCCSADYRTVVGENVNSVRFITILFFVLEIYETASIIEWGIIKIHYISFLAVIMQFRRCNPNEFDLDKNVYDTISLSVLLSLESSKSCNWSSSPGTCHTVCTTCQLFRSKARGFVGLQPQLSLYATVACWSVNWASRPPLRS